MGREWLRERWKAALVDLLLCVFILLWVLVEFVAVLYMTALLY